MLFIARVLYGVPLENLRKMYCLQYADDVLILIASGREDLRIVKLILFFL